MSYFRNTIEIPNYPGKVITNPEVRLIVNNKVVQHGITYYKFKHIYNALISVITQDVDPSEYI